MPGRPKLVLVGVGQLRRRPELDGPFQPLEPARGIEIALERAAADAGAPDLLREAHLVGCTAPLAWHYDDLPGLVAQRLGTPAGQRIQMASGGESPIALLNEVANRIQAGEARIALLAGAEAVYSRRRAREEGLSLGDWTQSATPADPFGGQRPLANALELRHGLALPTALYPLFENALRAEVGRTIAEHQIYLSELMARFSAVAAANPCAWFPEARSATEIRTVNDRNRWVWFPYPKFMNAIIEVDQAAACIAMSDVEAERRGIAQGRQVALLGGAKATDAWTPTERVDFVSSPAYRRAARRALEHARLATAEVDLFDLYSCFPSAVQLALRGLGLRADDPRPLTVTGGLAYAGGPGNNYSMHALCRMVEELRGSPTRVGYVSALGMTATKHAISLLSADPARKERAAGCASQVDLPADELFGPELVDRPDGPARIETYTVGFDRQNRPERSAVVLRMADGRRSMALGEAHPRAFERLLRSEGVGLRGKVIAGDGAEPNLFVLEE